MFCNWCGSPNGRPERGAWRCNACSKFTAHKPDPLPVTYAQPKGKTWPIWVGLSSALFLGVMAYVVFGTDAVKKNKESANAPAEQSDEPGWLRVPSDPKAKYWVIERGGDRNHPTITTKRVGSSGTSYSQRMFDCEARTWKYLGTGDTMEDMINANPAPQMGPVFSESITGYFSRMACAPP